MPPYVAAWRPTTSQSQSPFDWFIIYSSPIIFDPSASIYHLRSINFGLHLRFIIFDIHLLIKIRDYTCRWRIEKDWKWLPFLLGYPRLWDYSLGYHITSCRFWREDVYVVPIFWWLTTHSSRPSTTRGIEPLYLLDIRDWVRSFTLESLRNIPNNIMNQSNLQPIIIVCTQ